MKGNPLFREVLDNGLTVIVQEKETGSATVAIAVRFGTAYHPLAHFIGHMLFKGTERRTYKDINREGVKGGGSLDDIIDLYSTIYFVKTLPRYAYQKLDLLCDMVKNSRFPKNELDHERQVIVAETEGRNEEPYVILKDTLYKNFYAKEDIKRAITQDENLPYQVSRDELFNIYKQFYVPERLIIIAVGDVKKEKVLRYAEKYFGRAKGGVLVPLGVMGQKDLAQPKRIIIKKGGLKHLHLTVGFKAPIIHHNDYYPTLILSAIIGGNISSRFFEELREKRGLLYNIISKLDCSAWHGILRIYSHFNPENLQSVEEVIRNELGIFSKTGITKEELEMAKHKLIAERALALEGTLQHARMLAEAEINNRLKHCKNFNRFINSITVGNVRKAARSYCDINKSITVILRPPVTRAI